MKAFIPCEDDFLDQLQPNDRLIPWQTCWVEYLQSSAVVSQDVLAEPGSDGALRRPGRLTHPTLERLTIVETQA